VEVDPAKFAVGTQTSSTAADASDFQAVMGVGVLDRHDDAETLPEAPVADEVAADDATGDAATDADTSADDAN
ncbi:MAG: hypothetical protein ACO3EH_00795, partial [Ilumatobacteraceae bacterium]